MRDNSPRNRAKLLKRIAETHLESWLNQRRRKPLILRGARQVGKSTLVRNFCKAQRKTIVEINFEQFKPNVFHGFNTKIILREFEAHTGIKIDSSNCLLFLDEIQEQPWLSKLFDISTRTAPNSPS